MLPPPVSRLAEAGGDAEEGLADLVLLQVAGGVLADDARIDPASGIIVSFPRKGDFLGFTNVPSLGAKNIQGLFSRSNTTPCSR